MLRSILYNMLFRAPGMNKLLLGRWGYHWDKIKDIRTYYD
jgi:hypothetical protein